MRKLVLLIVIAAVTSGWTHGTTGPISGKLLLADGASFLLQVDGTSKICLAGGC